MWCRLWGHPRTLPFISSSSVSFLSSLAGIHGLRIGGQQASLMTPHGSRNIVHSTVEYSIFYTATVHYLVSAAVRLQDYGVRAVSEMSAARALAGVSQLTRSTLIITDLEAVAKIIHCIKSMVQSKTSKKKVVLKLNLQYQNILNCSLKKKKSAQVEEAADCLKELQ